MSNTVPLAGAPPIATLTLEDALAFAADIKTAQVDEFEAILEVEEAEADAERLRAEVIEANSHLIPNGKGVKVYEIKQAESVVLAGSEEYTVALLHVAIAKRRAFEAEIDRKLAENRFRALCNWMQYEGRVSVHIS